MDKLKELLHKGFFPIQLPPAFTTKSFADSYSLIQGRWGSQRAPSCRAEKFSVARSSYYRRNTSIVNPVGFFYLAKEIVTYWPEIQKHFKKSRISKSRPALNSSLRAIEISRFSELYEEKITKSAGYSYVLITDITSFFPTVYTHTIPWALHGKAVAKSNQDKVPEFFGNILDTKSMMLQDRQTIGLPIGPDTSHIIAEIIGTSIDCEIKEGLGSWPVGFRYVDDFYLFFDTKEEAKKGLTEVIKAIGNYELNFNPSKTKIISVSELVSESWKFRIKKLSISSNKKQQRQDLHHYFESLFSLEREFQDESLVKYGLKQVSSTIVKISNWNIFEAYLLKCGIAFPNTLQVITTILSTYNHHAYPINKVAIKRFCSNLILNHAISDHHSEVSWLLWLCKELEISLDRNVIRGIESMSNSVSALIVLDMFNSGRLRFNLTQKYRKQFMNAESLYDSNWLLAYEGGRRGWLSTSDIAYITNDNFFGALHREDIGFYDVDKKCKPIFEFKTDTQESAEIFDRDEEIEDSFEFDEFDEEYFDTDGVEDNINDEIKELIEN